MKARIYQPEKVATQSGRGKTNKWVLEYIHNDSREVEPIMGWLSSSDMLQEVKIEFDSRDKAVNYAKENNIKFEIEEPKKKKLRIQSYSDNFK